MAIEIENALTLTDYLRIAKRRWLTILATFLVALITILGVIISLTPVYKAEGFIAIDSPVISKALIGSNDLAATRYVDEHLDNIKRKVFSRENLVKFNEKHKLYPTDLEPSFIALSILNNVTIESERKSVNGNSWGSQVTAGLAIKVEYSDADKTYKVINDIISQLLDQNVKDRTKRATETTTYLTAKIESLKSELAITENKVAAYKQKHANSLPEHQELHLKTLEDLRSRLKELDLQYQATQEELRYLDVELTTASATINSSDDEVLVVSKLDQAREELERSLVLYKETHPTVRALKRKVALLENTEATPSKNKTKKVNVAGELAIAKINSQSEAARARLRTIEQEKKYTRSKIDRVKSQVVAIPQVERALASLLRDYENAKIKYDEVKAKLVNAKIGEDLELNNKAERFVLIDSPVYPKYKEGLSKTKMVLLGLPVSLILGFLLAIILEMFDKRVNRQSTLELLINAKPLAVIPYISTQKELNKQNALIKTAYLLVAILACLLIVLAITHFFITPIDQLLMGL